MRIAGSAAQAQWDTTVWPAPRPNTVRSESTELTGVRLRLHVQNSCACDQRVNRSLTGSPSVNMLEASEGNEAIGMQNAPCVCAGCGHALKTYFKAATKKNYTVTLPHKGAGQMLCEGARRARC